MDDKERRTTIRTEGLVVYRNIEKETKGSLVDELLCRVGLTIGETLSGKSIGNGRAGGCVGLFT